MTKAKTTTMGAKMAMFVMPIVVTPVMQPGLEGRKR